jgi:membrane-associated HD superfamily phosphohydrolase
MSYTYRIHVAPINRPVLSSVYFINSVYIPMTANTLLSSRLAVYFSSILLMRLWPMRQRLLTSFVDTRIRSVQISITA